jgi:hypothetical protein
MPVNVPLRFDSSDSQKLLLYPPGKEIIGGCLRETLRNLRGKEIDDREKRSARENS